MGPSMNHTSEFMAKHGFESRTTMPASVPVCVNPRFLIAENLFRFGPVAVAEEMVCRLFVHVFGLFTECSARFEVFAFDIRLHDTTVYESVSGGSFGPLETLSTDYVEIASKRLRFAGLLRW